MSLASRSAYIQPSGRALLSMASRGRLAIC
jgi:hypothetical protein